MKHSKQKYYRYKVDCFEGNEITQTMSFNYSSAVGIYEDFSYRDLAFYSYLMIWDRKENTYTCYTHEEIDMKRLYDLRFS